MVMNSIKDAKQLSRKLPVILTDLESRLNSSWKGDPWQLKSIEKPKYLVKFKMSRSSEDVKVDLLPRFEAKVGTDAGTYLITSRLVALLIIKFLSTWLSSQAIDNSTNERMRLSFRRSDFWDCLRGQALALIGRWYARQPLTNHKKRFSIQTIPEIQPRPQDFSHPFFEGKALGTRFQKSLFKVWTHSPYSFWSWGIPSHTKIKK